MMPQMNLVQSKKVRTVSRGVDVLLLVAAISAATLKPSYAYLDPSTGSFMLQMAIAGILGALFTLKTFWAQVKAFVLIHILHRSKRANPQSESIVKTESKTKAKKSS